jgi:hypothetical protein
MKVLVAVLLAGREIGIYGIGWPDNVNRSVTMATRDTAGAQPASS